MRAEETEKELRQLNRSPDHSAEGISFGKNSEKKFEYDAPLHAEPDGGAYVVFPWDIRQQFGKGRVQVHAEFDGIPYDGSIVNMGVRNPDGTVCYVIGVLKSIRNQLGKGNGDTLHVVIEADVPEPVRPERGRDDGKPQTIDEYIAAQDEAVQPVLASLRKIISTAIPDAEERISWSMPTYWKGRNLIHFAAYRKHIGLYPGDRAVSAFAEKLKGYDVSKGTVRFPLDKALPEALISEIARWCYHTCRK